MTRCRKACLTTAKKQLDSAPRVQQAMQDAVVALLGLERVLPRAGTVSSDPSCRPLMAMAFKVSAVERRAVFAPAGNAARRLAEALPALARGDPLVLMARSCACWSRTCFAPASSPASSRS